MSIGSRRNVCGSRKDRGRTKVIIEVVLRKVIGVARGKSGRRGPKEVQLIVDGEGAWRQNEMGTLRVLAAHSRERERRRSFDKLCKAGDSGTIPDRCWPDAPNPIRWGISEKRVTSQNSIPSASKSQDIHI